jgi:acetyl esterase/lipase/rhodanese-related sulfurtransferase
MQANTPLTRWFVVTITAIVIAPAAFAQGHTKDSLDMVKKALAEKKAVLIDVREQSEWDEGHLKDAKLLPLSRLKDGALPKGLELLLPKDKVVYLHCAAGRRVLKAADVLRKAGYDVQSLKEGYKELLTSGFPQADDKKKEPESIKVWPGKAPGEVKELPPEADISKPGQGLVAGKPVIRLGNVSTPMLAIYRPAKEIDTGAAVVICPGGGHTILAYDLEGTEVAEWLNKIGVTACVLKYRVPARDPKMRHLAAVQDAQRAMSVVRSHASEWGIDAKRIGILGFSAGGEVAGMTALLGTQRLYEAIDSVDKVSSRPDFAVLIYPAYFEEKGKGKLRDDIRVTKDAPPMFFTHAANDPVTCLNSLLLATELKKAGVPAELHLYATGGHGFGLRPQADKPCTQWPSACEAWLRAMRFTNAKLESR